MTGVKYTGAYALLLALHLLTVVAVIGPLLAAPPMAARAARAGRLDALRDHLRTTRVYAVASLLVVLLGSAMVGLGSVGGQWDFSQAWISASYVLWLVSVVLLLAVVVPAQTTAVERLEAGDEASSEVAALAGRISAAGGVAALALAAVIVLMVIKPGA